MGETHPHGVSAQPGVTFSEEPADHRNKFPLLSGQLNDRGCRRFCFPPLQLPVGFCSQFLKGIALDLVSHAAPKLETNQCLAVNYFRPEFF